MRLSSSSRPFASNQRTSVALPDIPMAPSPCFNFWISPATSPEISVVLFHVASFSVFETTYFGMVLMNDANGTSSPWAGQYSDHWLYSTRPIRNPEYSALASPMAAPISSLKYAKCHWSGASTTPSRDMKKFATILVTGRLFHEAARRSAGRPKRLRTAPEFIAFSGPRAKLVAWRGGSEAANGALLRWSGSSF